ncbi:hypothetical protein J6590_042341 [Homalodisca vitripennis]|nr:hypothetical protein J6590_042341 [Homalodisca vitripennis]
MELPIDGCIFGSLAGKCARRYKVCSKHYVSTAAAVKPLKAVSTATLRCSTFCWRESAVNQRGSGRDFLLAANQLELALPALSPPGLGVATTTPAMWGMWDSQPSHPEKILPMDAVATNPAMWGMWDDRPAVRLPMNMGTNPAMWGMWDSQPSRRGVPYITRRRFYLWMLWPQIPLCGECGIASRPGAVSRSSLPEKIPPIDAVATNPAMWGMWDSQPFYLWMLWPPILLCGECGVASRPGAVSRTSLPEKITYEYCGWAQILLCGECGIASRPGAVSRTSLRRRFYLWMLWARQILLCGECGIASRPGAVSRTSLPDKILPMDAVVTNPALWGMWNSQPFYLWMLWPQILLCGDCGIASRPGAVSRTSLPEKILPMNAVGTNPAMWGMWDSQPSLPMDAMATTTPAMWGMWDSQMSRRGVPCFIPGEDSTYGRYRVEILIWHDEQKTILGGRERGGEREGGRERE